MGKNTWMYLLAGGAVLYLLTKKNNGVGMLNEFGSPSAGNIANTPIAGVSPAGAIAPVSIPNYFSPTQPTIFQQAASSSQTNIGSALSDAFNRSVGAAVSVFTASGGSSSIVVNPNLSATSQLTAAQIIEQVSIASGYGNMSLAAGGTAFAAQGATQKELIAVGAAALPIPQPVTFTAFGQTFTTGSSGGSAPTASIPASTSGGGGLIPPAPAAAAPPPPPPPLTVYSFSLAQRRALGL